MFFLAEGLGRVESFFEPVAHEGLFVVAITNLFNEGHLFDLYV